MYDYKNSEDRFARITVRCIKVLVGGLILVTISGIITLAVLFISALVSP